ncbi:Uncharacterised protein [Kytococcus sedentarius]|uniref:Uncharacterized protein n=1 Tax=Kytococcus sedentarius (strain ATCC 14392 / DSM 20547 / JCM 11482 / CCUG 33030 / NBRC 15357 / NCTC 11040 / CCM 314 / 541) TaxID=478801 RepID=C7NLV4_KYTSD|nr:hypothetical protein Ksed_22200 [Kytococcus sedentarius DSM 20547]STX13962.1 Uncharacterised protein [Kytococcus sedentarius]
MHMHTTVTAAIAANGESRYSAAGITTPPRNSGRVTCHTRSPVRSAWRAQSTIATAPKANGMAVIRPTSMTV